MLLSDRHAWEYAPISILSVTTFGDEVGPQDRRTLSHPFAHYWVYRKEALRVIGLHPLSWTAIEDTYLGALDRAWKNESQPKVVKAHLLAEGAQQRDDGVLISCRIELGDERQCVGSIEEMKRSSGQAFSLQAIKRTKYYQQSIRWRNLSPANDR
ncbi:hypothetical protein [Aeromonas salmonicida]|uniref:hypothetical protein n=1 Tax=Aeromonas salmonicida TaxID=645 RepID=UPI00267B1E72